MIVMEEEKAQIMKLPIYFCIYHLSNDDYHLQMQDLCIYEINPTKIIVFRLYSTILIVQTYDIFLM
jgi:hypothetical protein